MSEQQEPTKEQIELAKAYDRIDQFKRYLKASALEHSFKAFIKEELDKARKLASDKPREKKPTKAPKPEAINNEAPELPETAVIEQSEPMTPEEDESLEVDVNELEESEEGEV